MALEVFDYRTDLRNWPSYHALQIRDFVLAIQEDREPAVTAVEGRKSIEIVKAIYQSARPGAPVSLPLQ